MRELKSILILTALEQEQQALLDCLKGVRKTVLESRLDLEMMSADLGHRTVSVVKTGIGSVNAALALHLASRAAKPFDAVILLGVGGALREDLSVGDLVVSDHVLQHDYYYSFDHGDQRIRPGALILSSDEARGHQAEIKADPRLVEWIKGTKGRVGTILSGSEFVGRVDRKRAIAELSPSALLVDMEAAGVAQLAERLQIPFVVAKTVADRLNPDGSIESDFRATLDAASAHAAAALHALLES